MLMIHIGAPHTRTHDAITITTKLSSAAAVDHQLSPESISLLLDVNRNRGKLITFLRQFFLHRPERQALKQSGVIIERVFGCDLGEYLMNSALICKHYHILLTHILANHTYFGLSKSDAAVC